MLKEKTEIEKLDIRSSNISENRKAELFHFFPEIRTESGKIDFEKLKLALGETIDADKERYSMNWPGKAECFNTIQTPSMGTLRPLRAESINFEGSENLVVEGDNLEVLKLLQKAYLRKIKMIYIDPPYNTGNDFIYPDNYTESLQTYLQYTGQVDIEGKRFGTNTDTDGRFHSKWMNMIYPRLYLARNLLSDDGVIFVSIDDREITNLRRVMDEIFGEDCFLAQFIWHSKKGGGGGVNTVVVEHEYIVAYAKLNPDTSVAKQLVNAEPLNLQDEQGPYRKGRELNKWGAGSARADRPTMYFPIKGPNGDDVYPIRNDGSEGRWRLGKAAMLEIVKKGNAIFEKREDGLYTVYEKIRSAAPKERSFRTLLNDAGTVAEGTAALKELFGGSSPFDFPKPPKLIRKLMEIAGVTEDDIVLDFFAGSATTGHAVLMMNEELGTDVKFILVQLPEKLKDPKEFETVADITKQRLRKAIEQINKKRAETLDLNGGSDRALGFRVFKLDESCFKAWGPSLDSLELEKQLELHVENLRQGRTPEDVLFEILFKSGFPLTTTVDVRKFQDKKIFSIAEGMLLVCLEDNITLDFIKHIAEQKPERVVCLDQGFANNDQLKANAVQIFRTKGIASFKTV